MRRRQLADEEEVVVSISGGSIACDKDLASHHTRTLPCTALTVGDVFRARLAKLLHLHRNLGTAKGMI